MASSTKTFELLAQTRNPAAVDLLIAALDVASEGIQAAGVAALVKRRTSRGIIEVVRRLPLLETAARELVEKNANNLGHGLRDCLLRDDSVLRGNALELVRRCDVYGEIPTLIALLQLPLLPERSLIEEILAELINRLYEHLPLGGDGAEPGPFLRDAERIRQQTLATLQVAGCRFPAHRCRHVIEGLLILGDPENVHVRRFLREAVDETRSVATDLICSSAHPGVMRLVVDAMTQNYPFATAFTAFERRADAEFICTVLRRWPRKLSIFHQKNLREIRSVPWLEPEHLRLDMIPAALHGTLIAFLMATGMPQAQKLAVLEWMVQYGSPEGRLAATDVLVDLEDDKVQEVVVEGLDSDEPDVQAWATGQLRNWSIPNAMELLIERLDSPIPEVQQAARNELAGFNIYRAIELFDELDGRMQVEVGKLVRKIDPDTIHKLREQMQNAIRRKRIRAARAALAMKLHLEVVDALLTMARDSDNLVRRTAAEVLGKVPSREAVSMLVELTHDASPRVRDTAAHALHELHGAPEHRGAGPSAIPESVEVR
jgi:hypothetical protein